MQSFGIIVIAPLWGLISAQLFFQTGEEFIKAIFYFIGIFKRKVSSKKLLPRFIKALALSLICAILLVICFWLICVRYAADLRTPAQNVLYLAFAILGIVYIVARLPYRLGKAWRHATVKGAIEEDAQEDAEYAAEQKEIDERRAEKRPLNTAAATPPDDPAP